MCAHDILPRIQRLINRPKSGRRASLHPRAIPIQPSFQRAYDDWGSALGGGRRLADTISPLKGRCLETAGSICSTNVRFGSNLFWSRLAFWTAILGGKTLAASYDSPHVELVIVDLNDSDVLHCLVSMWTSRFTRRPCGSGRRITAHPKQYPAGSTASSLSSDDDGFHHDRPLLPMEVAGHVHFEVQLSSNQGNLLRLTEFEGRN
jgi:hypothetical protein